MQENLQRVEESRFLYVFTKTISRKTFAKEMEGIYEKHYKKNYEQDGFRPGEVPFHLAEKNAKLLNSLLKTVALVNRQLFVEEIIMDLADTPVSIYDISEGENQTSFEAFDLSLDQPIVFEMRVELASYVEKVDYEKVSVDPTIIKTKTPTDKDLENMFKEYKKVKEAQNKATKTSYVELVFRSGEDTETLTFNLAQKFSEGDDPLKIQTHEEVTEHVMGKSVGDEFDYFLKGKDGSQLAVKTKIKDIYRIRTLSDDEFVEMLKETGNIPEEQKEGMDIEKVRVLFKNHLDSIHQDNYYDEVRSLTFASLRSLTEGIYYNEREIDNLKNQFVVQVQKTANEEKTPYIDYVVKNFGSVKLMEDYVDASQRARVLQAAMYRRIGKDMNLRPSPTQLEAFVKAFLFKIDPKETVAGELMDQINEQVTQVLSEALNRQRIIESWASVKAEDKVNSLVGLLV
jgi:hypothetical protein